MATNEEPLLLKEEKVVYFEGCPGCKQQQKNEANPGIPYREFVFVWVVALCSSLPISSLFPFLYFMVITWTLFIGPTPENWDTSSVIIIAFLFCLQIRDLHIAQRVEDIGYYAGFVGSSFMLGRAFTSIFWGMVADKYGRKPVIVISIVSVIIFNTLFGLSASFWMAITTRSLLGFFSGLLGPIKAYATEVCRKEHQALGISLVSTSRGIGLIIGPAIGGYLSQPAEKFPNIFTEESVFGRFPYFLPCLCISLFAVAALIACFWLPETLHMHGNKVGHGGVEGLEASSVEPDLENPCEETDGSMPYEKSLFRNWSLISTIIVYCVFSLHDTAYSEIFSLWAESDKRYGGLSFTSKDVGEVLAISGFSLLLYQLFLYPRVVKDLGPITSSRVAAVIGLPLLACYPFMAKLCGFYLTLVVNSASVLKNVSSITIITGLNILQNNAVPQHQRGAANGISVTAMSLFKTCAPAGAGILFSWAQKRQQASFLPGDQMVFFVLNVVALAGLLLTCKPFLALPSQKNAMKR